MVLSIKWTECKPNLSPSTGDDPDLFSSACPPSHFFTLLWKSYHTHSITSQTHNQVNISRIFIISYQRKLTMPTVLGEPVTYDSGFAGPKPAMDPKEQFYRKFESQATGT